MSAVVEVVPLAEKADGGGGTVAVGTVAVCDAVDAVAFHNLSAVTQIQLKQGNVLWEAATGGCVANTYMVRDTPTNTPIFIMEEKSTCMNRCCCNGCQPLFVKFYNTEGPYQVEAKKCCCITCVPAHERFKKNGEAVMTVERPGFTCGSGGKCCLGNMWVCHECCQAETFVHAGNVGSDEGTDVNKISRNTAFSSSRVPIGGGGFTPTVEMMERDPEGAETPFGFVEGPTCFGGCMDLFVDTYFTISRNKGKSGDIATIKKKARDEGMKGLCIALCTPVDTYDITLSDPSLTPQQKASIIAEAINLDFLFFENEQPLCRYNEASKNCEILCCLCYCYGCLCPCKCIIPTKE